MQITKSSRHSKITGDFGERLILYWLSKYGFECAFVDHVGLDIIARNPHTEEVMGISVKSRSRNDGKEGEHLNIRNDGVAKLEEACRAFNCVPYFAIVIDGANAITVFILSKAHLVKLYPPGKVVMAWKMSKAYLDRYDADPEIKSFRFTTKTSKWWP